MTLSGTIDEVFYTYTFERNPEFGNSESFERVGNIHINPTTGDFLYKHIEGYVIRNYTFLIFDLTTFLTFEEIVLGYPLTCVNYDEVTIQNAYIILKEISEIGEDVCLNGTKRTIYSVSFDLVSLL